VFFVRRRLLPTLLIALLPLLAPLARAEAPSVIPEGSLGYWRFDPDRFQGHGEGEAGRALMLSTLRALVASGVVDDESRSRIVEGVLAAAEIGAWPHTLCLMEFQAGRSLPDWQIEVESMQAVLEIRTKSDHRRFLRTLKAIVLGGSPADDWATGAGSQKVIDLPAGVQGVTYREPDWAGWRTVSWASVDGAFLIGLGEGALERWLLAQRREQAPEGGWIHHRAAVDVARPAGDVFFEAYANLNAMRRGYPNTFIEGRTQRVASTLNLSNAREFMLHGRWLEPASDASGAPIMIGLDATWSARSDAPGEIGRLALSESDWPGNELRMDAPPGSYVIAMRADWLGWLNFGLRMAVATVHADSVLRRHRWINDWAQRNDQTVTELLTRLEPWLILSDAPPPIAAIPGATTLFAEVKPGADDGRTGELLEETLAEFREALGTDGAGLWWLKLEPTGTIKAPAWGVVGPPEHRVIVGGWGPPAVIENKRRLEASR